MSQLLVIDVQETYRRFLNPQLIADIISAMENSSDVIYLWDEIDNPDFSSECLTEIYEEIVFEGNLQHMRSISKEYGFFRGLMDELEDDEILVRLGKFLIKHRIADARDLENPEYKEIFDEEFGDTVLSEVNMEDFIFFIPSELMESLRDSVGSGVVLIGGGRKECLREISILLRIMDIDHTINESLTY